MFDSNMYYFETSSHNVDLDTGIPLSLLYVDRNRRYTIMVKYLLSNSLKDFLLFEILE